MWCRWRGGVRLGWYSARVKGERATEAQRRELDRVGAFSDGVFAIAITLLVLNLDMPSVTDEASLGDSLRELDGDLTAYFIGFAVMGRFWYEHHRLFSVLERSDPKLIWVNMLLLSLVALMPFTTDLIGTYDEPVAVAVYAVNVGLASLAAGLTELIAVRDGLGPEGAFGDRSTVVRANAFVFGVFILSVPIAFLSTTVAKLSWLLLFLGPRFLRRAVPDKTRERRTG